MLLHGADPFPQDMFSSTDGMIIAPDNAFNISCASDQLPLEPLPPVMWIPQNLNSINLEMLLNSLEQEKVLLPPLL